MQNSDRNQDSSRRDPRAYENPREGRPDERGFQGRRENDDMEMAQSNRDTGRYDHDNRGSVSRGYEGDTNRGYSEGNGAYGNQSHTNQGNQGRMNQDYSQGNQGRMNQGNQDYGHQGQGNQGRMNQDYGQGQGNQGRFNAGNQDYGHQGQGNQGRMNQGNQDYGHQGQGNQGRFNAGNQENQSTKGRPPRGYKRSDERIQDDICDRLMQQGHIDVGDIEVKVEGGEVTLTGTIESRALKHTVENLVDAVSGVQEIHNQLRVKRQGQNADASSNSTAGQQTGQKSNVESQKSNVESQKSNVESQKSNVESQKGQGASTGTSEGKQENGRHQAARHTS